MLIIILATRTAEELQNGVQLGQFSKTVSKTGEGCNSRVEHLLSMLRGPGSILSTAHSHQKSEVTQQHSAIFKTFEKTIAAYNGK